MDRGLNERLIKCELQTLITLDHQNLVQFREWFEDPSGGIFFVMELCDGGGLDAHLEYIAGEQEEDRLGHIEQLKALMRQMCYAASYIHAQGVVHRDLKPANVQLSGKAPRRSSSTSAPTHLEAKPPDARVLFTVDAPLWANSVTAPLCCKFVC